MVNPRNKIYRMSRICKNAFNVSVQFTGKSESENQIFHAEERRYLANSLGDPLIKGLTEVVKTRPQDPVTYLASFLYNFAMKNKSPEKSHESNVLIIGEREEETNDNTDDGYPQSPDNDIEESNFSDANRDEHGQSILHFAAVQSHGKDALFNLLQETGLNVGYRDEVYRTGRDVAERANIQNNVEEIDRWVVYLAARGETEKLVELLLEGYDHILDTSDSGNNIMTIASEQGHESTVQFLQSIPNFVSRREQLHNAIRVNDAKLVKELFEKNGGGSKLISVGKNVYGRCALHIAVLKENAEIVEQIAQNFPETLRIGDNLDRTALHYAMALPSIEVLSSILIKAGAKRVKKDLKSRQPSYYYMNKSEIQNLQEEEDELTKS